MVIAAALGSAPVAPSYASSAIVLDALDPFAPPPAWRPLPATLDFSAGDALVVRAPEAANADQPPGRIDVDIADSRALSLRFTGRTIDLPDRVNDREERLSAPGFGRVEERPFDNVREERRYDGNVRLSAADERVRFSSSYRSPDRATDPAFDRVDYVMGTGGPIANPTLRERVDVVPVSRGPLRVASYGQYLQYGPLGRGAEAFTAGERSRSEFGADVELAPVKFGVSGNFFATNAEYLRTALTTRERTQDIHAEVALTPLLGAHAGVPSRLGVAHGIYRSDPFEFGDLGALDPAMWTESQRSKTNALTPSWDWRLGTTSVSFTQAASRSSLLDQTTDVSQSRGIEMKQTLRTGAVRAAFNLGYADVAHIEPAPIAEGRYRSGAELRLGLAGLPELNAKSELTVSRSTPAAGEPYATRHWRVSTGLDFSKLLPEPLSERSASLRLSGILRDNQAKDSDPGAAAIDTGVSLMGRIAF